MSLLLDHIFIMTEPGAPAAKHLQAIGLVEGASNVHPGQGTSNRRFFLGNTTIELLYISDVAQARSGTGSCLGLLKRYQHGQACPFGVVVRVVDAGTTPEFPSWQYFPDYFANDMCFYVGSNSDQLIEPLCICMPPSLPEATRVQADNVNADWLLTSMTISVPVKKQSETLNTFAAIDKVNIEWGQSHKMLLTFNNGVAGRSKNLMPDLPMILQW
jgi:hypothetical protein